ncbi:MAG TPA: Crp/Fnr family transcriptional regulator [Chitinophagaceae bacterium]|nr:Crp/Fnr family transcriptional regulator [Chitinophagaceae bacterium]
MDDALQQLQKFINAINPLNEDEWNSFAAAWKPFSAKRKTMLTTTGETEKYLYFVIHGVQRAFYMHHDKEATIVFTYPYSFSGVADSFLLQSPSKYYFETLTGSEFLRTAHQQILELMEKYRNIEKLILKSSAAALHGVLQRQIELQCFSAEEKFLALLHRSPHVLSLIPHKYLASYLGIDATTFSKLLGSVRI